MNIGELRARALEVIVRGVEMGREYMMRRKRGEMVNGMDPLKHMKKHMKKLWN